jgi:hypothetical protein
LKVPPPWDQGFEGTFARGVSAHDLPVLVNKAAAMTCARIALFARNDPMYEEELAKAGGPTLNTLPALGYLEYFSLRSPQKPLQLPIAAIGVVIISSKPECTAK